MAFETINLGTQPAGTGGDTARSSFEKVNRNFLAVDVLSAAMSQVQFEAIREQNKEKYAASGFVHMGKHYHANNSDYIAINEGLWTNTVGENNLQLGKSPAPTPIGNSKSDAPVAHIAGVIFYLSDINSVLSNQNTIKFPQAPDGKTTYNKSTGVVTTHANATAAFNAQAADPTNVEVVIDRLDIWGFEAWLEEVNTINPYVYPNGLIQSQVATMDGISTSSSNRIVTYYAAFDGDTGSKGKGLNFFALTDSQKKKVLANHKNNLYYLDDGRLVQWRLRQRTIAGAGNGDWVSVSPAIDSFSVRFSANNDVIPQGILNTTSGREDTQYFYSSMNPPISLAGSGFIGDVGSYQISPYSGELSGVNGECYFLVCGIVNRLNKGAYHPSFNPNGTANFFYNTGEQAAEQPWYDSSSKKPSSTANCFDFATSGNTPGNVSPFVYSGYGSINGIKSGRQDGRFYDAIYASGQGGVCRDMRYSAYAVDAVNSAEAEQRVKNGTYRGFEKTKLATTLSSFDSNVSVGGNFLVTEVIATNSVINATAALSGGWSGFKNAQSPTGAISFFELSRDAASTPTAIRSTDNGASWSAFAPTFNAANNSVTLTNEPAANIVILQYQAFATQTEIAPNAVLAGIVPYNVFASSDYRPENGALLGESLIGKVLKNNTGVSVNNKSLLSCTIDGSGKLTSASNFDGVNHQALTLGTPANNSPAFKVVSYLANINQQAVPHFAYTELKHNGSSWGDDGKVTIVDNQSTKTDLNGNTVLVGTAKLKEPIGWIKNKV